MGRVVTLALLVAIGFKLMEWLILYLTDNPTIIGVIFLLLLCIAIFLREMDYVPCREMRIIGEDWHATAIGREYDLSAGEYDNRDAVPKNFDS
ncbi:hypothetical protein N7528_001489 [Penicillium herquei]|nr:hypothetical protein N7528_001489 [Penicillium herquei]